jgi:hypothetical protein
MAPGKPGPLDRQIPGCPQTGLAAWERLRKRCGSPRYAVAAGWSRSLHRSVCEYLPGSGEGNPRRGQRRFDSGRFGFSDRRRWSGRHGVYYHGGSERKSRRRLGKNARLHLKIEQFKTGARKDLLVGRPVTRMASFQLGGRVFLFGRTFCAIFSLFVLISRIAGSRCQATAMRRMSRTSELPQKRPPLLLTLHNVLQPAPLRFGQWQLDCR